MAWHPRNLAVALAVALSGSVAASGEPDAPRHPNVLWITIDTLRADALGWSGSERATPRLDGLAARGAAFPRAVAPVPLTFPSHASMFSGLVPRRHGARDNGSSLDSRVPVLAERLRSGGWRTAAIVSGHPLRSVYGLDRGFEHFDDRLPDDPSARWGERKAEETGRLALARIAEFRRESPHSPWFLWVHFFDPHDPYEPPAELAGAGPRAAYLGEVAAVDRALGPVLAAAESAGPTLFVVTSDHGESLGEHGEPTHGFFLYESTVTVPLLLVWDGKLAPRRIEVPARLVDLAPTVLDLLGLNPLPDVDGESLRTILEGRPAAPWPAAEIETLQPWLGFGWSPLRGLRSAERKLILAPRPELYDLLVDPAESDNRFDRDRAAAAGLARELRRREERAAAGTTIDAADPEDREALAALGYLSVGASGEPPRHGLADPKDRLASKDRLERAEAERLRGAEVAALAAFDAALALEPDNRFALLRVGQLRLAANRPVDAMAPLERLLALDPRNPEARWALAEALSRSGQRARARAAWSEVVRRQPRRAAAWSNLGAEQFAAGELEPAVESLRRAHDLDPADRDITENLATLLLERAATAALRGDLAAAEAARAEAITLAPGLREAARRDRRLARLPPP